MQYNQPFGIADPNAAYINGNPSTGTQGSIPPAASIEYPQREIANLISDGGLTPSNGDLRQLGRSLQSGHIWYGVDTGVKNAVQVSLTPAPLTYYDGMFAWILPAFTNDGAVSINFNAIGARTVVRRGGGDLLPGDLIAGYKSLLCYSGAHANFELYGINFTGGTTGFLPILTQNTTLYVNTATGSDTLYDGTSATVIGATSPKAGPFKTINRAMTETFKYGPSVYTMTIQVAAGTYAEAINTPNVVGPAVSILGANKTTTFVTGAANSHTFLCDHGNTMVVKGITVSCGAGSLPPSCFMAQNGGTLTTDDCATSGAVPYAIWEAYAGYIYPGTHIINSGVSCQYVISAFFGGFCSFQASKTVTIAGAITVGTAFAGASANGTIAIPTPNQPTFVNPGSVTGQRYLATVNASIVTQGLGANYFPGTVAGSTATGGVYA
jgi:hypothetical protein